MRSEKREFKGFSWLDGTIENVIFCLKFVFFVYKCACRKTSRIELFFHWQYQRDARIGIKRGIFVFFIAKNDELQPIIMIWYWFVILNVYLILSIFFNFHQITQFFFCFDTFIFQLRWERTAEKWDVKRENVFHKKNEE